MDRDNKLHIAPGMIARVDVLTCMNALLIYLLKPVNRIRYIALRES